MDRPAGGRDRGGTSIESMQFCLSAGLLDLANLPVGGNRDECMRRDWMWPRPDVGPVVPAAQGMETGSESSPQHLI